MPSSLNKLLPEIEEYEKVIWAWDEYRILKSYKLLENCKPGKILDIGCMGGKSLTNLKQKGWDCYGIELSDAAEIALARGINCLKHDVSKGIPFNDEFFDVVWAEEVIEHLMDTDSFLAEANRVLKRNGVLIISTPNIASLINRLRLLFGRNLRYVQYNLNGPGHIRYYTLDLLRNQLLNHDFRVNKIMGNFLSIPDPTKRKFLRKHFLAPLGTWLPSLSENLIVRAEKI
jgi:SAM-dependent methyltransferase